MKTRSINGVAVSAIGLGCMNFNHAYQPQITRGESERLLKVAFDSGITHFDTAALYGFGRSEEWVGAGIKSFRSKIFLASKCGMTSVNGKRVIDGRPETLRNTCAEALKRLQVDHIDLYYLHRWDKQVPIEESVGALADLVRQGSIRAIGLSEVSVATLRKAHAVHPIAAIQNEYSLWTRNPEHGLLNACRELGVALVAFSPLGRGFLTGALNERTEFAANDIRRGMPRFQTPHRAHNAALVTEMESIAREAGCTKSQLALAWLLQKAPHVLPIFGTTRVEHLQENISASNVRLNPDIVTRLDALINASTVSGARYPPETLVEIDTEESR